MRQREREILYSCFEEKDVSLGWGGTVSNGDIEKEVKEKKGRLVSYCEECRNNKIEDRYDIVRLRMEGLMKEREKWEREWMFKRVNEIGGHRVRRNGC